MVRLAMCGWETQNIHEIGISQQNGQGSQTIRTDGPRTGNAYYRAQTSGDTDASGWAYRSIQIANRNELWVRIAAKNAVDGSTSTGADRGIVQFMEGSTRHIMIGWSGGSDFPGLQVYRNITEIAEGGSWPTTSTWAIIEIHVLIADSGGRVEVFIDNTQVINFTGDTRIGGSGVINEIRVGMEKVSAPLEGGSSTQRIDLDDLAINDVNGTVNNGRVGQGGILVVFPDADTAQKDFLRSSGSDNFALVDEAPPDDDTTYVESGTLGARDLYNLSDIPVAVGVINAAQVVGRMRSVDASGAEAALTLNPGTPVEGANKALSEAYAYFSDIYDTNPETSADWLISEINSLEAGLTVK